MNKWNFKCLSSKQECAGTYVACHNFVHHIYLDYLMHKYKKLSTLNNNNIINYNIIVM